MRISDWSSDVCSSDLSAYEQVFGVTLRFSQPDSKMIFPAAYMQLPVANADDDLRRQVEARAQSMLQRLSGEPELLRALKAVLSRNLANGRVQLADSASALEMTPRTLQRRLAAFVQSYHRVLEAVRRHAHENLQRDLC